MRLDQLQPGTRFRVADRVIRETGVVEFVSPCSVRVRLERPAVHVRFGDGERRRDFVASGDRRTRLSGATQVVPIGRDGSAGVGGFSRSGVRET